MDDWEVCRLCLRSSEALMKSLPDVTYNMIPFCNIYFELVGITFTEYPSFPGQICTSCEEEMMQAYKFREKCLETEEKLKDLMNEDTEESKIEFINTPKAAESPEKTTFVEVQEPSDTLSDSPVAEPDKQQPKPILAETKPSKKKIIHKFSKRQLKEMQTKNIQCKRCNEVFKGIELFKNHSCNKEETSQTEPPPKKLHTCTECGRSYTSRSCYNSHMDRQHTKNMRYACSHCDKKFFSWLQRRTHIYKVHLKKAYSECPHCGKGFTTQTYLTKHINAEHLNLVPYQCSVCGKTFKQANQVRVHESIHTGMKECKICGKKLKSNASLRQHKRTHSNEKNYICPVCSKGFTCNFSMKTHVRKLHPDDVHLLPPDGTIVNQGYLRKMRENDG